MGMPQVPDRDNIPNIEEVLIQILESVALEELAMAHIINAEGEKMQALVRQLDEGAICCNCMTNAFKNTSTTINSLIMKEWIMLSKITAVLDIYNKIERKDDNCRRCEVHTPCTNNHRCENHQNRESCNSCEDSKFEVNVNVKEK